MTLSNISTTPCWSVTMIRDEAEDDDEEDDDDCMVLRTLQTALCSDTHRHVLSVSF
jgi:hypothetical protein